MSVRLCRLRHHSMICDVNIDSDIFFSSFFLLLYFYIFIQWNGIFQTRRQQQTASAFKKKTQLYVYDVACACAKNWMNKFPRLIANDLRHPNRQLWKIAERCAVLCVCAINSLHPILYIYIYILNAVNTVRHFELFCESFIQTREHRKTENLFHFLFGISLFMRFSAYMRNGQQATATTAVDFKRNE